MIASSVSVGNWFIGMAEPTANMMNPASWFPTNASNSYEGNKLKDFVKKVPGNK